MGSWGRLNRRLVAFARRMPTTEHRLVTLARELAALRVDLVVLDRAIDTATRAPAGVRPVAGTRGLAPAYRLGRVVDKQGRKT